MRRGDYLFPYTVRLSTPCCSYCLTFYNEGEISCRKCGSRESYVVDLNKINRKVLDFPSAFAIQKNATSLSHHVRCSSVQLEGALLCDCDAIPREYSRLIAIAA